MDQTPTPTTTMETKPDSTEPKVEAKIEAKAPQADKSVLNKDEPKGAPDKYEAFKVPDGFVLAPEVATEVGTLFKELGLSQIDAQRLIDFHTAKTAAAAEAPMKAYTEQRQAWRDAVAADPEIGSKLSEVKSTVSRALDGLGDPKLASDFRAAMDLTGAGDNPAFIKAFYKLAQKVTEGRSVTGSNPSGAGQRAPNAGPRSAASALYPNLP